MYQHSIRAVIDHLFVPAQPLLQPDAGFAFIREMPYNPNAGMDHLVCFLPAVMITGAKRGAVQGTEAAEHERIARELTDTCVEMYRHTPSGVAPEISLIDQQGQVGKNAGAQHNLLRPEAVEALFFMWRFTKEQKYRDWGWLIFEAFQRHSRGPRGFSSLKDVYTMPPLKRGKQESFFLAETLKYLLLLFSDDSVLPLDQYVFNTEAHPFPVFPDSRRR
jgi:hypothetical protein